MKTIDELRKGFEENKRIKRFMYSIDIEYTNLGGYRYKLDGSPCYFLNGAFMMYQELKQNDQT